MSVPDEQSEAQEKDHSSEPSPAMDDSSAATNTLGRRGVTAADQSSGRTYPDLSEAILGEFRLLRRLGSGGMADVYLAEQTSLKRLVAVKVLRPDFVAHEVYRRRFEQEAMAAAALNHANIVQVFAVGETGGTHYIAQEYVQGINLRQFLNRKGPPSVPVALRIIKQVALALRAAGEAGIVHRDIKPGNILITRKGQVKVADFGLAQLTRGGERLHLTQAGVTLGTPLYMSPEQVNGEELDQRSDIYSLGVTCYHLLAGRPPFSGETALSVAVQHLNETPAPLMERRADLPRPLCDFVHKMMAKNRSDRYPDAKSVWAELTRIEKSLKSSEENAELTLGDFDTAGDSPTRLSQLTSVLRPKSSRLWSFVVSCAVVFLLAAGLGWMTRPANPLDAPVSADLRISKQDTPEEQFYLAMTLVDNEEAWKAVRRYYPETTRIVQLATLHLAVLYLRTERLDDARGLFTELAGQRNGAPSLRANALAGLAVVASLRGDYQESHRIIETELVPVRQRLDHAMQTLVRGAIVRNQQMRSDQLHRIDADLFRTESDGSAVPAH